MKISKSLSLKVNLGNYQVTDFFVSIEKDVEEKDVYKSAQELHSFCKSEITKDVNNSKKYLQDLANGKVEEKKMCICGKEKGTHFDPVPKPTPPPKEKVVRNDVRVKVPTGMVNIDDEFDAMSGRTP